MVMLFFEKPGCAGNARQKKMLMEAGVMLSVQDMLSKKWTPKELEEFFLGAPLSECFNENAPQIKSGEIDPGKLSRETALLLMVDNPILIKRPLIRYKGEAILGFDLDRLGRLVPALGEKRLKDPGTCSATDACS